MVRYLVSEILTVVASWVGHIGLCPGNHVILNPEFLVLSLEGFIGCAKRRNLHIHYVYVIAINGGN